MTSSSDLPGWVPASLSASAARAGGTAFAGLGAVPVVAATSVPEWLRPLRTSFEEQLEAERVAQRTEAYRRGVEEAAEQERERAEQRRQATLQAVQRVADQLETISAAFARDRERDLHGLAVAIARQVVQHELMIDPLRVGELVRRALELLPLDATIEVRMNPGDLATLGASPDRLLPPGREVRLVWLGDPGLAPGDFVVETPGRLVDGRADVALRDLYERLEHD